MQTAEDQGYCSRPEPGQLVDVRTRQWVVADVHSFSANSLSETLSVREPAAIYRSGSEESATAGRRLDESQHLVTLRSIDEDSLGEELEVIWEIEPGARVIERAGLPTISGQDDATTLDAFLDAVRWGAATNVDRDFLQAPFRSGVSIEDFQLDPLVRAIGMARANLLIADDVGLGKTIESGLVIQELLLRHRAKSVLVICPASLQEKWRIEMLEKFGLEFKVVNKDYMKQLRRDRGIHVNPWVSFPRLITSVDWLKSGDALRTIRDVLPSRAEYPRKFDMLIVDEAHNVAPAGSANYVLESQRTNLIRTLSPHFQHRLFLTATPHNGYTHSFTSLLELLDDQRFSRNIMPDEKQLAQVMIRRLKTDIVDSNGNLLYPTRNLQPLPISFTSKERAIHKTLEAYCSSREKTCRASGTAGTKFINGLLKKRLFSSPAAFASTLERHFETLTSSQRIDAPSPLENRILRKAILKAEEDYADDADLEEAQVWAIEEASKRATPLTDEEQRLLDEMRTWAQKARHRIDSKASAVLDWIERNLKTGGKWNDKRVILFTEYLTTLKWLQEILVMRDCGGDRLGIIHGGMDNDDREIIKAAFQADPSVSETRILLATDAASEGIDLQNHCNCLIHIEIPYNPNVMEQRNGRIDRYGQKQSEVLIWHPVDGGDARDDAFGGHKDDIIRALRKLNAMREDMGSVNPVIAPQMAELIEGSRRAINTQEAEARSARARHFVRAERHIRERIARLHERLQKTRKEFHLTPDRISQAVKIGLALSGKPPLKQVNLEGSPEGSVFKMPVLTGSWARCLEGLRHPHTNNQRPITFDHDVGKNRDDVVLVHLNHRLVQMCLQLMRAEVWAQNDVKKLHRVDVRTLPDSILAGLALVVVSRLVITGGTHHRLHEELTFSGGYFRNGAFAREARVMQVSQWIDEASPHRADEGLFSTLTAEFRKQEDAILRAVQARSSERLRNLQSTLENRKRQEIDNIEAILSELARAIENELKSGLKPEQIGLFTDEERNQVRRDIDALKARLARLPYEKEQEIESIENRYRDFMPRTLPVAVIFLVAESTAGIIKS
ncbi:MAG: DEAD/DEAH box helicase [Ectothiorhodospiraceae bacterium AqS1]|nr:DEAD/DEAH box helicase [Ectothiorhodospiraceae bacterium AqS1]